MTAPFFIPNLVLIGSMDGRYPGDHGHMLLAQSFPSRARTRLTGCSANIFCDFMMRSLISAAVSVASW
ncbi:hypothetical protein IMSAG192_01255 [Muribaculaceae bacterium]|nr:hypothetical protein IMSAG192_01255 [Muribaculaceae bacterium]